MESNPRLCVTGSIHFRTPSAEANEIRGDERNALHQSLFRFTIAREPARTPPPAFLFLQIFTCQRANSTSWAQFPISRKTILKIRTSKDPTAQLAGRSLASVPEMAADDHSTAAGQRVVPCSEDGLITAAIGLSTTFSNFFMTTPLFHRWRFDMDTKKPEKCSVVDATIGAAGFFPRGLVAGPGTIGGIVR